MQHELEHVAVVGNPFVEEGEFHDGSKGDAGALAGQRLPFDLLQTSAVVPEKLVGSIVKLGADPVMAPVVGHNVFDGLTLGGVIDGDERTAQLLADAARFVERDLDRRVGGQVTTHSGREVPILGAPGIDGRHPRDRDAEEEEGAPERHGVDCSGGQY